MKILNKKQSLIIKIGVPILAAIELLAWFFPNAMSQSFRAHWIILLIAIVFAFCPWGKIRLAPAADAHPKYKLTTWLAAIISLQLALQLFYLEILHFSAFVLPILNPERPNPMISLIQLGLNQGLFPWALFALQTINFALCANRGQQDAYFHTTINSFWPSNSNQAFGITCDFIARGVTLFALSANAMLLALWLLILVTPNSWRVTGGFNLATILIVFSMLLLCLPNFIKNRLIQRLKPKAQFSVNLLKLIVAFSVLLFALNSLFHGAQTLPIKPPSFIQLLQTQSWRTVWILLINCWWLAWLPLISITSARFSQGYQVRQVLAAMLIWPALFTFGFIHWHPNFLLVNSLPNGLNFIIALIAGGLILTLSSGGTRLPLLILCYLPKAEEFKPRPQRPLLRKIFVIMAVLLYLYLPAGILGLTPFYLICGISMAVIAILAVISLCKHCRKLSAKST